METFLAHTTIGITVVVHVAIFSEFVILGLNLAVNALFHLCAVHIFLSSFLLLALVNGKRPEGPAVGINLRFLGVLSDLGHSLRRAGCCLGSFVAFRHLGGCSVGAGYLPSLLFS